MFLNRLKAFLPKISIKLTLTYSLVLILSSTLFFGLFYYQVKQALVEREFRQLENQLTLYRSRYQSSGLSNLTQDIRNFVMVLSPSGESLFVQEGIPNLKIDIEFLKVELLRTSPSQKRISLAETFGDNEIHLVSGFLPDGKKLIVGMSSENRTELLKIFSGLFGWFIIPAIFLGLGGGLYLSAKTARPIRELIATMKKIESGSLSTRIAVGGGFEDLEQLKILSNKMLDKIESLVNGLKEAFDHLAHDIRTPVTRLRGRAELALNDNADVDTLREALQSCYENSDKILNFLQVLTDITEAENRSRKLKLEKRYLSDLVREIMNLYEMSFEEKNVQVVQKLDGNDWAMVDARLISRVIANLLDNAYKYTPSGGEVTIETVNQTESVILRVTDTGPGVAANEQSLIWQKLYRSDKSRSEYGMGLGLTFVKAVVEAHDGKVSVHSPVRDGHGTQFEITLQKMS